MSNGQHVLGPSPKRALLKPTVRHSSPSNVAHLNRSLFTLFLAPSVNVEIQLVEIKIGRMELTSCHVAELSTN